MNDARASHNIFSMIIYISLQLCKMTDFKCIVALCYA
jgi:hypothetical protein